MVALDPPEMRQSIAWEFVLMALRKRIAAEAEVDLSEGLQKRVRDVEVGIYQLQEPMRVLLTRAGSDSKHDILPIEGLHYRYLGSQASCNSSS